MPIDQLKNLQSFLKAVFSIKKDCKDFNDNSFQMLH